MVRSESMCPHFPSRASSGKAFLPSLAGFATRCPSTMRRGKNGQRLVIGPTCPIGSCPHSYDTRSDWPPLRESVRTLAGSAAGS